MSIKLKPGKLEAYIRQKLTPRWVTQKNSQKLACGAMLAMNPS